MNLVQRSHNTRQYLNHQAQVDDILPWHHYHPRNRHQLSPTDRRDKPLLDLHSKMFLQPNVYLIGKKVEMLYTDVVITAPKVINSPVEINIQFLIYSSSFTHPFREDPPIKRFLIGRKVQKLRTGVFITPPEVIMQ